jgi:hypothetical protein
VVRHTQMRSVTVVTHASSATTWTSSGVDMDLVLVNNVLVSLQGHSLCEILLTLLSNPHYDQNPHKHLFIREWPLFLTSVASTHPALQTPTHEFARTLVTGQLTSEVARLAERESGWHISAKQARADHLESFDINSMSCRMQEQAPLLSGLLGSLLDSDPGRTLRQQQFADQSAQADLPPSASHGGVDWSEEDEYWWAADLEMQGADNDTESTPHDMELESEDISIDIHAKAERARKRRRRAMERRVALLKIVSNLCLDFLVLVNAHSHM